MVGRVDSASGGKSSKKGGTGAAVRVDRRPAPHWCLSGISKT
jgi:hypothetical protein